MNEYDKELLRRIENLIVSFQVQVKDSEGSPQEASMTYGLRCLVSMANMILRRQDVFGLEPWHIISPHAPLAQPGEMLLRLKDYKGETLPPYPMIMAFYNNGYTAQIDGILFLAALEQFRRHILEPNAPQQVTINVSARSLRDADFVKVTLERLEDLLLSPQQKVIIEIHESSPHLTMSRQVLELYKMLDVGFAIDDVGLNMNDVLRLAEFEGLAEYIKIDRHAVNAPSTDSGSLAQVMAFLGSLMPDATIIAEGVQNADHALQISRLYPNIHYVQGLYLPQNRDQFKLEYYNATAREKRENAPQMHETMPVESRSGA